MRESHPSTLASLVVTVSTCLADGYFCQLWVTGASVSSFLLQSFGLLLI